MFIIVDYSPALFIKRLPNIARLKCINYISYKIHSKNFQALLNWIFNP